MQREVENAQREVKAAQQALKNYEQSTKQVDLAKRQLEHEIDRIQKEEEFYFSHGCAKNNTDAFLCPLIRLDLHINQNPTYRVR